MRCWMIERQWRITGGSKALTGSVVPIRSISPTRKMFDMEVGSDVALKHLLEPVAVKPQGEWARPPVALYTIDAPDQAVEEVKTAIEERKKKR